MAAQPRGFIRQAKLAYDLDLTEEQAIEYRNKFFTTYPRVESYHKDVIAFCKKHKYVMSPIGRMRRLPDINNDDFLERGRAERQALNHGIQGLSSDIVFMACNQLFQTGVINNSDCSLIGMIHDELLFECRDNDVIIEKYVKHIRDAMENPKLEEYFNFKLKVPMKAEAKIGYNFSDMEPYDG